MSMSRGRRASPASGISLAADPALLEPRALVGRHRLFVLLMLLKGLNGLAEILGGAMMFLAPIPIVTGLAAGWAAEIAEAPNGLLAHALVWASAWQQGNHRLVGAYLLIHGLAKLVLVGLMAIKRVWAYPTAIAVFGFLSACALASLAASWNWALAAIVAFDALAIWVIYREWGALLAFERPVIPCAPARTRESSSGIVGNAAGR